MGGLRFNAEPVGGKIVHSYQPHRTAGAVWVNIRRVAGYFVFKGGIFSLCRSFRFDLLLGINPFRLGFIFRHYA